MCISVIHRDVLPMMFTLDNILFCMCVNRNLRKTESKKNKLENQLNSVGAKVNELKEKYITIQWFHLLFLPITLPFVLYSIYFVFVLVLLKRL